MKAVPVRVSSSFRCICLLCHNYIRSVLCCLSKEWPKESLGQRCSPTTPYPTHRLKSSRQEDALVITIFLEVRSSTRPGVASPLFPPRTEVCTHRLAS